MAFNLQLSEQRKVILKGSNLNRCISANAVSQLFNVTDNCSSPSKVCNVFYFFDDWINISNGFCQRTPSVCQKTVYLEELVRFRHAHFKHSFSALVQLNPIFVHSEHRVLHLRVECSAVLLLQHLGSQFGSSDMDVQDVCSLHSIKILIKLLIILIQIPLD